MDIVKDSVELDITSHELTQKTNEVVVSADTALEISGLKKEYSIVGDSLYAGVSSDSPPQWLANIIDNVVNSLIGQKLTALDTAMNSINASLRELEIAKNQYQQLINIEETIDGVLVSKLETLNATVQQNSASIIDLDVVKTTADEALAITINHLNSEINNGEISSLITQLNTTIANNELAAAESINQLEAVYNENESTVRQILSSETGAYTIEDNAIVNLVQNVTLLQKQTDGLINTYANTYDVMLGIENPNNNTDNDQLVTTVEPYASWVAEDTLNGNENVRLAHIGDVYIKYALNSNSTKEYIASYKFVKVTPDTTSPYSTDPEGYTWIKVIDQVAQDAYMQALNAYALADGKVTNYYAIRGTTAPATDKFWMDVSSTPTLKDYIAGVWQVVFAQDGDMVKAVDLIDNKNNKDYTYSNGTWVEFKEGGIYANAESITNLSIDLETLNTDIFGATGLENTLRGEITAEGARVESKFAYNSSLNIGGVNYSSGFGLVSDMTGGVGNVGSIPRPPTGTSEFWVQADKFKMIAASQTAASQNPFSVNAGTGEINFNGKVSFTNVTGAPGGGSNLLYNSAPMIANETKGWSVGWYNTGIAPVLGAGSDPWRPSGGGSVYVVVPGAPTVGTVFDVAQTTKVPVIGGTWYEASAYISSHRCTSYVTIAWFDSNNTYITEVGGSQTAIASGGALSNWSRSTLLAQAPTNAAKAHFYVRSIVSSTDPYCFVAFAYLGKAVQGQAVFSDWSEGTSAGVSSGEVVNDINNGNTTTINGGRITTGSITANQIAANSISTNQIAVGTGIVNGYVQSSDFTGIGGPGFRLKSNAAGTSADPSIYGAYIKGGTISGSVFSGTLVSPTVYDVTVPAPGTAWTLIGSFTVPKPSSGEAYKLTILSNILLSGGNWVLAHFDIKVNGVSVTGDYTAPLAILTGVGEKSKYALSSAVYTNDVTVTIYSYQSPGGYNTPHTTASINILALASSM